MLSFVAMISGCFYFSLEGCPKRLSFFNLLDLLP